MDLILIKTFTYSHETTNAIGILDLNQIEYFIQESTISNTFDYLGQSANGIKLFVNKDDEAVARQLLLEAGILKSQDFNEQTIDYSKLIKNAIIIISILLLILLIIYFS